MRSHSAGIQKLRSLPELPTWTFPSLGETLEPRFYPPRSCYMIPPGIKIVKIGVNWVSCFFLFVFGLGCGVFFWWRPTRPPQHYDPHLETPQALLNQAYEVCEKEVLSQIAHNPPAKESFMTVGMGVWTIKCIKIPEIPWILYTEHFCILAPSHGTRTKEALV